MISQELFNQLYQELQANFNAEKTAFYLETAYSYLSRHFDDKQFQLAVRRSLIEETFFPTPKRLVELVHGSQEVKAGSEWDLIINAASRNLRLHELEVSEAGKASVQHIGGLNRVGLATEDKLVWLKKEFVSYFKSYSECPPSRSLSPSDESSNGIGHFTMNSL